MYHLDNQSGVSTRPDLPAVHSSEVLWFTEGGNGIQPSYPGAHWFNTVQAELLNVLTEAGIEPSKGSLNQLALAINKIINEKYKKQLSDFSSSDAYKMIGRCTSIQQLRNTEPESDGQRILLDSYTDTSFFGGGKFYADFNDKSTLDDGANCVVTQSGARWKRLLKPVSISSPQLISGDFIYTLEKTGDGLGNVVQSFTVDDVRSNMYSLHIAGSGDNSRAIINKFSTNYSKRTITADSYMAGGTVVGHQGLSAQVFNNNTKLWSSAGKSVENYGCCAVRFIYEDNGTVVDYERFKLFDENDFKSTGSTTPCISYDQQFLIVRGYLISSGLSVIRVFKLNDLTAEGDYSDKYVYQFGIKGVPIDETYPLQGIASNGQIIVLQFGYNQPDTNKILMTYSIDGQLLTSNFDSLIGKEDALSTGIGNHYEPEGIAFMRGPIGTIELAHCIVSGDSGKRTTRIYIDGVSHLKLLAIDDDVALFLNAKNDIGISKGDIFTVSEVDDSGEIFSFLRVKQNQLSLGDEDNAFVINKSKAEDRDFAEIRSNKEISKGAGFNLYGDADSKNPNRIIFYSGGENSKTINFSENNLKVSVPIEAETPKSDAGDKSVPTIGWIKEFINQRLFKKNGWVRHPSGIIEQWVKASSTEKSGVVQLPIIFPNKVLYASVCEAKSNMEGDIYSFAWIENETTSSHVAWKSSGAAGDFVIHVIGY